MSGPTSSARSIRLDTDHVMQELMAAAIARISGAIRLEVRERQVLLTGTTESWHEKQQAQESLRSLSRDYLICNEIRVAAWN